MILRTERRPILPGAVVTNHSTELQQEIDPKKSFHTSCPRTISWEAYGYEMTAEEN